MMLSNMILIPQGKRSSKCWKPTFYDSIQLIQPNLYATIGLTINPVDALNSVFVIIKPLPIEGHALTQCHSLDHSKGDF